MPTIKEQLACCYFPTQTVVVDDELAVADSLRFTLGTTVKSFSQPTDALNALATYAPCVTESLWLSADETSDQWDGLHKQPIMIDIKKMVALTQDKNRYNDIGVVIVDYHMPEMNGLALLQQWQDKPFKKILLTGEATTALAVQAFNDGLIDQFFRKDDVMLQTKIRESVATLKRNYFIDLCKKTLSLLEGSSAIFLNPAIAHWFYEKIAFLQITEFYLLDMHGSFLLIDKNQQKKHVLIHTKEYIDIFVGYAETDHAAASVIDSLRTRQGFPYFGEHQVYWKIHAKDWCSYMKPIEEVKIDNSVFYVAVF